MSRGKSEKVFRCKKCGCVGVRPVVDSQSKRFRLFHCENCGALAV